MPELNPAAPSVQPLPICSRDHSRPETLTLDCPVTCLDIVLSASAYRPLYRMRADRNRAIRTIADVVALYQQGKLRYVRGLGVRRIGEIAHWLDYAGVLQRAGISGQANTAAGDPPAVCSPPPGPAPVR